MPVATVVQAAHPLRRPGNDVRNTRRDLLLAAGTPERPRRAGTADPPDEPFTVTVRLAARRPADGPVQVEPGVLVTSAMGSGHDLIVAGSNPYPGIVRRST